MLIILEMYQTFPTKTMSLLFFPSELIAEEQTTENYEGYGDEKNVNYKKCHWGELC